VSNEESEQIGGSSFRAENYKERQKVEMEKQVDE